MIKLKSFSTKKSLHYIPTPISDNMVSGKVGGHIPGSLHCHGINSHPITAATNSYNANSQSDSHEIIPKSDSFKIKSVTDSQVLSGTTPKKVEGHIYTKRVDSHMTSKSTTGTAFTHKTPGRVSSHLTNRIAEKDTVPDKPKTQLSGPSTSTAFYLNPAYLRYELNIYE